MTPDLLRSHQRNVHEGVLQYQCGVCFEKFKSKNYVERHVDRHLQTPHYRCTECLLEFHCQATGYIHIKKVHGKGKAVLKMDLSEEALQHRKRYTIKIDPEVGDGGERGSLLNRKQTRTLSRVNPH